MVEQKEYLEIVFVIIALVFTVYTYTRDYYLEDQSKVKSAGILAAIIVLIIVIIAVIIYKLPI